MAVSDAQKRALIKYGKQTRQYILRFRLGADADVIAKLADVKNKTGYIRSLIRRDLGDE